jgi:hypothetical protein
LNTGIKRNDTNTWGNDRWPINYRGIKHFKSGHADFMWNLRCKPNILQVFRDLWETDNLLTSFDGFGVMTPHHTYKNTKNWWHTDQSPEKNRTSLCPGID